MVVVKADACSAAGLYIPSEKAVPLAWMSVYCDQAASWYVRVGCLVLVARDCLRWTWQILKQALGTQLERSARFRKELQCSYAQYECRRSESYAQI
jgi:hypothetical protein